MFTVKSKRVVIVANAMKHPSINTWVELCDLKASTGPVIMLHKDPNLGAQSADGPHMIQELLPHGIYFLNMKYPEHLDAVRERGPVGALIMPELTNVWLDGNDVKFSVLAKEKETHEALKRLLKANPEMYFGLGTGNVNGC